MDYDQYRLEHPDEFPTLAAEETRTARSNIDKEGWFAESAARLITVATAGLVLFATASSSQIVDGIYRAILKWLATFSQMQ